MPSLLLESESSQSQANGRARVINVASLGERMTSKDSNYVSQMFDAGLKELKFYPDSYINDYDYNEAYSLSKSSNILFSKELVKRYGNDKIVSMSLQPGGISETNLTRNMNINVCKIIDLLTISLKYGALTPNFVLSETKSIAQGAATTVRCVSLNEDDISNGSFYHNCREKNDILQGIASKDKNGEMAAKLWELSKKLLESKGHPI